MPPDTNSLRSQLNNAFQKSFYNEKRSFLPSDDLERIISTESVTQYCSTYAATAPKDETSKILEYVFGSEGNYRGPARQVFAILVLMNRPSFIPGVVAENIRDHDLPLAQCAGTGADFQLARNSESQRALKCFSQWEMSDRISFDVYQYQVNVPIFRLLDQNKPCFLPEKYVAMELDDRSVLPFTDYDRENQITSGSSKVVRVQIHTAHNDFNKHVSRLVSPSSESPELGSPRHASHAHMEFFETNQPNESFALKTLDAGNAENETHFRLEVTALTKIRAKQKPHLVDVLTTFKYDNKYHLLFRWACGGNLSSLWKEANENLSRNTVCWIAQQCWGLADGLDGIHNAKLSVEEVGQVQQPSTGPPSPTKGRSWFSALKTNKKDCGRHGDIKPPNILWFKQDENDYEKDYGLGVLKISDFGLTTFHTALTTQAPPKDQNGCTWTYAPPEYDLKEDISRPFDIWSLGCVYLEFITWALLGPSGIKDFQERRLSEHGGRPKWTSDSFYCLRGAGETRDAMVKVCVEEVGLESRSSA